jgi:hypothetical protein
MSEDENIGRLYQAGRRILPKETPLVAQMSSRMVLITEEERVKYEEESYIRNDWLGEYGQPWPTSPKNMTPEEIDVVNNMFILLNSEGYILDEGVKSLFMLFRGKSIVRWLGPAAKNKNGRSYSINFEDVVVSSIERYRWLKLKTDFYNAIAFLVGMLFFIGIGCLPSKQPQQ